MKFLGKLVLTVLLVCVLVIVLGYVLLQTQWAAGWLSRWVSANSDYRLTVGKINHDWSAPASLTLQHVRLTRANQPEMLNAEEVTLGLDWEQLNQPGHLDRLTLRNGSLNLSNPNAALPVQANLLQLSNMRLVAGIDRLSVTAQQVDAGIAPWHPAPGRVLGNDAEFQLSAGEMTINDMPATQVLVQGRIQQNRLLLNNVGADFARGQLTANASRDADGSWNINNLRLSNLRLQSPHPLSTFQQDFNALPKITLQRLDVIDARLQGPDWAFNDLDVTLQNMTFEQGDWQSEDGSIAFNASDLINGSLHVTDPIVDLAFDQQGMTIKQLSTRWQNGLLRTTGHWSRTDRQLQLDELVVAALEYTLPANWRTLWMQPLPAWLSGVSVSKLTANRNLIIDVSPDFPFQLTALDGTGNDLVLARDHQWGIWNGKLTLNASDATFNKIDVRRPSLSLAADADQIAVTELSAFTQAGLLESTATLSQQPQRTFSVTLNGRAVPLALVQNWGWPTVPASGDGTLQVQLQGQLAAGTPLKTGLNGQLTATDAQGQQITQQMVNGTVTGAAPAAPAAAPLPQNPAPPAP
ncbi:AsmA family protein [Chimaeribacter arupi]|uniref:AsmA family protein n=2 Tax=Yersiniaceae TaxID=1903411 RepID=A0A2N5ELA6_9GAMM|nr:MULTISPECIES: AsmA family protein [Yersiniaceae]MBS0971190.1 AsmA family protein [Nissabacter archeti]MDV5141851.1 AsmA family protein [Chimaeribacter arupi]PLR30210.1 AsmA family protein [Chimaeribacter arupi]PLR42849.1 AsmA family protein [Chimaeribacter arupi]PLR47730.1 AsmA family protein [Chimaeribacter arupi]